ncbi:hypothetical protein L6R50_09005 [Myxococcota bacterium]|nr:hypothetical protein [Myxococcota bacterium]
MTQDVKIRTGRDCVAWYRDRWLVAYMVGSELRVRDWTTGQEQWMAGQVGSFALAAAAEQGAMLIYVRLGALYCRRLVDDTWLPSEQIADWVEALPSLCCYHSDEWDLDEGIAAEVVYGVQQGGCYARRYESGQWDKPRRLDDGSALAEFPAVCSDAQGHVYAAWRERSDDPRGSPRVRIATKAAWALDWTTADQVIEDAADPSIAHDGASLWVGVHHDWTVRVHQVDVDLDQPGSGVEWVGPRTKLASSALFVTLRADPAGEVAAAWSWWAGTGDSHRDDLRGVACAVLDDNFKWAEQACTKEVGQCQPGLARGKTSWALAWADTVAGQVRLLEIPMRGATP